MIFSNKIYKISSGKNISLYAEDENSVLMFIFKELTEKKSLEFSPVIKCNNFADKYSYNKIIKINDSHYLICFDKNVSVTSSI